MCINYILLYIYRFSLLQSTFKIKVPEVDATAEAMHILVGWCRAAEEASQINGF